MSVIPEHQNIQQGIIAGRGVRTLRGLTNQRNSTPEKSPPRLTPRPFGWLIVWMLPDLRLTDPYPFLLPSINITESVPRHFIAKLGQ